MKRSNITSLFLAVVALSTGTSAEKEAAQTFGYIGDPTDYGYGYGHGAGVGAGVGVGLGAGVGETAMEELGLDCAVRVMAMVELGLELVLDSKAPVMVMVTPQSKVGY
ncbi:hypothetical protein Plhal710r2_c006g0028561 [Plasmopara halstedii]